LDDVKRVVVDVHLKRKLPQLVTLAKIKQDAANWENFDLLRLPRLSVVPVSELDVFAFVRISTSY
jgi:predicted RNA-binding protein with PUA-like domain